jgi:organic hydroperoxide reductase OsmC/OhrA
MQGDHMSFVTGAPEELLTARAAACGRAACLHEEHRLDTGLHRVVGELVQNRSGGVVGFLKARAVIECQHEAGGMRHRRRSG